MGLVKYQRLLTDEERQEARLWSLWLLYGKAPSNAEPDADGFYDLQEIGETKSDRGVDRPTPYSPARGLRS
jgi:hypothetical protein